jgi:hypothetical protein
VTVTAIITEIILPVGLEALSFSLLILGAILTSHVLNPLPILCRRGWSKYYKPYLPSRGVRLRGGRQTIQSYVEGVGDT